MTVPTKEINDLLLQAFTTDGSGNIALRFVASGIAADSVNDTHVDWGLGANQISAEDIPIRDTAGDFTATNIEDALIELFASGGGAGAPTTATYIVQVPNGSLSNEQALSALATGIVKNTTTTGVLSIAVAGTDYYAPGGTDVAVLDGGTGASTASDARTNLGLAIGSNVQAYDATLAALASYNTNGLLVQTASDTFAGRTVTGTADKITITNGDGVAGNPTITIAATYIGQNTITTLGTITTGVWTGTAVAVANGGTGSTTASDARTALGLAIGTNVQAYDLDLDAISALATFGMLSRTGAGTYSPRTITGTADKITVTNGDGVSGNPTLTIASTYIGQNTITTLGTITTGVWTGTTINVANGGSGATTLTGILKGNGTSAFTAVTAPSGAIVGTTDTQTLTNKTVTPRVVALTDAATVDWNCDNVDIGTVVLAGNRTLGAPTGTPYNGQKVLFRVRQDATGTRTLAYNAVFRFGTDVTSPTLTTTAAKTDHLGFIYNSTDSKWDCLAVSKGY